MAFEDGADTAVYLAPHICLYETLEPAVTLARERGLVLVHRVQSLPDDGMRPDHGDLLLAVTSPAFVATSGEEGHRFADWWLRGIAKGGTPARWLEIVPSAFPTAAWQEDPGFNVSFWNIHERLLERRGDALVAQGQPLRFIDFWGFRPDRPYVLNESASQSVH